PHRPHATPRRVARKTAARPLRERPAPANSPRRESTSTPPQTTHLTSPSTTCPHGNHARQSFQKKLRPRFNRDWHQEGDRRIVGLYEALVHCFGHDVVRRERRCSNRYA